MKEIVNQFSAQIEIVALLQYLGLATLYAVILGQMVKRSSTVMGDKGQYQYIFPILVPTMVLIIVVIKTSLALSLGLVGALSIVRFRTPIKEPMELAFLFVAIAVGLGIGAGQIWATSISFFVIIFILFIMGFLKSAQEPKGLFLDVQSEKYDKISLSTYFNLLKEKKISFEIRRVDETPTQFSATFYLELNGLDHLDEILNALNERNPKAQYSFLNRVHPMS
ncbi:DUF4956 domain-containing protein [Bacteriovoracaceae bacterium]|nr:DUF4956 domain-containing protein [Bacteriovoracaceae bacterium]